MKLTDNLYSYIWDNPYENNCNSYYIGGTVRALIDPGLSQFVPDLFVRMENDGIDIGSIRYVINTHSHPDHFEGSSRFIMKDNVDIALGEEELLFYRDEGHILYRYFGLDAPEVPVTMPLREGPLTLGEETFEILEVPGHSPGSIALYMPSAGALVSGDVIFDRNIGRTDFPGGSSEELGKSIRRLSSLDTEYLLPGHIDIVQGARAVKNNFSFVTERILPYL